MKPVKIAQVGLMHDHGVQTLRSLCKLSDHYEVVGIWEPNEDLYARLPQNVPRYSLTELLEMPGLEAVTIETTELESTVYAQQFAERGIAIHMDKPGSPDLESFRRLISTVQKNNLTFQMGYMYRYHPLLRETLELARKGELGEIYSVEAQMSIRHSPQNRQWLERFPGGMMFFLGCHLVDLILQFQGKPEEVLPFNTCTRLDGITSQDYGFALLRYPNGISFVKSCACEYNGFARRQLVVCGSRGTVEIKPLEILLGQEDDMKLSKGVLTLAKNQPNDWIDSSQPIDIIPYNRYDEMMCSFARKIRQLEVNPYPPEYELELFETLLRCCGKEIK